MCVKNSLWRFHHDTADSKTAGSEDTIQAGTVDSGQLFVDTYWSSPRGYLVIGLCGAVCAARIYFEYMDEAPFRSEANGGVGGGGGQ